MCESFTDTHFHTARFEIAFRVREPIFYEWRKAEPALKGDVNEG